MTLLWSFILGIVAGGCAYRARALTPGGAAAASVAGGLSLAAGPSWTALLLTFFLTSTLLSRGGPHAREERQAKSGPRDAIQVLANGAIPAAAAALHLLHIPGPWSTAYAAALAAANADTWATEIGRYSHSAPRLITTGRAVVPGMSGAISWLGTVGAIAGTLLIGTLAWVVSVVDARSALSVALGGLAGAVVDSLLGATLQERRWCALCASTTEQSLHRPCGSRTQISGGVKGLNNDAVNILAIAAGTAIALLLHVP